METLQMLKHMLKKECLNFMKGWSTEEAAMSEDCGVSKATGLGSLFKDKPDIALGAHVAKSVIVFGKTHVQFDL